MNLGLPSIPDATRNTVSQRNKVVDNARGLGILLILLGHASGLPGAVSLWIFSFHVPLFFVLAGYSVKQTVLQQPLTVFLRRQGRLLLLPYLFSGWSPTSTGCPRIAWAATANCTRTLPG
ncbi:MAG: acyltransferase family protein [Janthinobacterium lividum]